MTRPGSQGCPLFCSKVDTWAGCWKVSRHTSFSLQKELKCLRSWQAVEAWVVFWKWQSSGVRGPPCAWADGDKSGDDLAGEWRVHLKQCFHTEALKTLEAGSRDPWAHRWDLGSAGPGRGGQGFVQFLQSGATLSEPCLWNLDFVPSSIGSTWQCYSLRKKDSDLDVGSFLQAMRKTGQLLAGLFHIQRIVPMGSGPLGKDRETGMSRGLSRLFGMSEYG